MARGSSCLRTAKNNEERRRNAELFCLVPGSTCIRYEDKTRRRAEKVFETWSQESRMPSFGAQMLGAIVALVLVELLRMLRKTRRTAFAAVATLGWVGIFCGLGGCGAGGDTGDTGAAGRSGSSGSTVQQVSLTLAPTSGAVEAATDSAPSIGLTITQTLNLSATTTDGSQIRWNVSPTTGNGSFSAATTASGAITTFTAPSTAGLYTVTATSASSGAQQAAVQVGVTDLAGVLTYHNNNARDGANIHEYALTAANVTAGKFGKLFSCTVDSLIRAQPLWLANVTINGAKHNVVYVATAHDTVFAFDADAPSCTQLWTANLIDNDHGGTLGETPIPAGNYNNVLSGTGGANGPEIGVTGTPVIDAANHILYVVSKSVALSRITATAFYQRLHAIDATTGKEMPQSPILIQGSFPGAADGTGVVTFDAARENQRTGLTLLNGTVYIAWGAHGDIPPYYGWVIGYRYTADNDVSARGGFNTDGSFTQAAVLNVSPNVGFGGIWMSGAAPAADAHDNLYLLTGNGIFDAANDSAPNNDYGDSLLKLAAGGQADTASAGLTVSQYFTPSDQASRIANDLDFGSGGAAVLIDVAISGSTTTHLVIGGGKDGTLYLINGNSMGGYGDQYAWQKIPLSGSLFSTVAYWNQTIYLQAGYSNPWALTLDTSTSPASFKLTAWATMPLSAMTSSATPVISATGSTNGILWLVDWSKANCIPGPSNGCGPAVLYAYDATTLAELWDSTQAGTADTLGNAVQFLVPTVANGKVYVGTRGNNTGGPLNSTTIPGELDVYGLKNGS
jgi:hypothetical protein